MINRFASSLSEEILTIKEEANRFIMNVKAWEKELTDEQSPKSFNALINHYNKQNENFSNIFRAVSDNYMKLDKRLSSISGVVAEMTGRTSEIRIIAEKIKVLSINASIEAARASSEGKGFKVIANEIKKLSGLTNDIIESILRGMTIAREEVAGTVKDFGEDGRLLRDKIMNQQNEFTVFYTILGEYSEHFRGIFESFAELIAEIDTHIKNLNPLFQLHEISIQEMENLNKIISDFLGDQRSEMDTATGGINEEERKEHLRRLIREYERKIISKFEIGVLEKVVGQYDVAKEFSFENNSQEVDYF